MNMRTWAVPGLILLAGTTLAACGDTEPAASPSPTASDAMMEESMTEESATEDAMEDDSMDSTHSPSASEDAMMEEDSMEDEG